MPHSASQRLAVPLATPKQSASCVWLKPPTTRARSSSTPTGHRKAASRRLTPALDRASETCWRLTRSSRAISRSVRPRSYSRATFSGSGAPASSSRCKPTFQPSCLPALPAPRSPSASSCRPRRVFDSAAGGRQARRSALAGALLGPGRRRPPPFRVMSPLVNVPPSPALYLAYLWPAVSRIGRTTPCRCATSDPERHSRRNSRRSWSQSTGQGRRSPAGRRRRCRRPSSARTDTRGSTSSLLCAE